MRDKLNLIIFDYINPLVVKPLWEEQRLYSETLNNEYIERIHQMSYSSLSDNGML